MQSATLLFCLLAFMIVSVQPRRHQYRDISSNPTVYRKLQARIVPVVSSSTSRVHTKRKVESPTRRHGKRQNTVSSRISAALSQFIQTLDAEAANIKSYSVKGSSPDTIFTQVKGPLENILRAAQQALADVKNSEYAPAPSGGFQTPPTSPCSMILSIIRCLKHILEALLNAMDFSYVQSNLGDTITQITGLISQLISEVGSKVPGAINDIMQMGSDVIDSIRSAGFGFDDIVNVVKPQ